MCCLYNFASKLGDQKKRLHEAGAKSLRQVSYRQETYRAVTRLYFFNRLPPRQKMNFFKCVFALYLVLMDARINFAETRTILRDKGWVTNLDDPTNCIV